MTDELTNIAELIAIVGALVAPIIFIIRLDIRVKQLEKSQNDESLSVLKIRLAKGEITEEEFNRLRKKLK